MSKEEQTLVKILKGIGISKDTTIAIILLLDKKKVSVNLLLEYLRKLNKKTITEHEIIKQVMEMSR